jgi:hypothetical protein
MPHAAPTKNYVIRKIGDSVAVVTQWRDHYHATG